MRTNTINWKLIIPAALLACAAPSTKEAPRPEAQSQLASTEKASNPYASLSFEERTGITIEAEVSADGSKIVALTEKAVKVFQASDGLLLASLEVLPGSFEVDISPDDRWFAVGGENGAQVWSFSDFSLQQTIKQSEEMIQFSRDSYLTTATKGSLYIWDLSTKKQIAKLDAAREGAQKKRSLHTYPTRWLMKGSTISFWSLQDNNGRELLSDVSARQDRAWTFTAQDPKTKKPMAQAALQIGGFFATTENYRWALSQGQGFQNTLLFLLTRFDASVTDCDLAQSAPRFCETSNKRGEEFFFRRLEKTIHIAALSHSGKYVITVNEEGEVKRWSTDNFSYESKGVLLGFHEGVREIEISANDQILLTHDKNGVVKVWSLETGTFLYTLDGAKRLFEPTKI